MATKERISLNVNNKSYDLEVDPNMPLLYALRNELDVTGPKFGCGLAQCGACTVIVDGRAMRSCMTSVRSAQGRQIRTIEGLGTPENPHPVQKAFIEESGAPVRLLHQWLADDISGTAGRESSPQRY